MSDLTLDLLEKYMKITDFDEQFAAGDMDDLLWGGNILTGDKFEDEKSYEEWLKYYGMEDDEED